MRVTLSRSSYLLLICLTLSFQSCLTTRASSVDTVSTSPSSSRSVAADARASTGPELDEIKQEITLLNGRLEDLERINRQGGSGDEVRKLHDKIAKLEANQQELEDRIVKLQSQLPPPDPETLFARAKQEFDLDNHAEAVQLMTSYLKAKGKLKHDEEATFLKAESLYELKNYKQAILDYNSLIEKFKKSKYHAKALFKTAQAFDALGLKDDAQAFYKELQEKHPKSPEARSQKKQPSKSKKAK